jgi:hypothetical protein
MRRDLLLRTGLVFFMLTLPSFVAACPVCYTDPESPTASALTYAIAFLLGVTGVVLGGFVGMFLLFRHRSKKIALNGATDYPRPN